MKFDLNGSQTEVKADNADTALEILRDELDLTGTKLGCGSGACGACTILVDGDNVCACLLPASHLKGKSVQTIEAHDRDNLHPVQLAFMQHDGLQCGYCTSGFINSAIKFYDDWRAENGTNRPDREDIAGALSGNICRCGAYDNIYTAVTEACIGTYDNLGPDDIDPPRIDAIVRVTGEAQYTNDRKFDGMQHAAIVRSIHPYAEVTNIDLSAAKSAAGVCAAIECLDDPENRVRHVGTPIAAVAAASKEQAEAAAALIEVSYNPLEAVLDTQASRNATNATADMSFRKFAKESAVGAPGFPGRWTGNSRTNLLNVLNKKGSKARSLVKKAKANGDPQLYTGTFSAGSTAHTALEPHGFIARWEGDDCYMEISGQGANVWKEQVAKKRKMKKENLHVSAEYVGGAFGSKANYMQEASITMDLAKEANQPVALIFHRHETIETGGYRQGVDAEINILVDENNAFKAMVGESWDYSGHCVDSITGLAMAMMYQSKDMPVSAFTHDVVTHHPKAKEFRGPGGITAQFFMSTIIDRIAEERGIDPIELRDDWASNPADHSVHRAAQAIPEWQNRATNIGASNAPAKKGIGFATGHWLNLYNTTISVQVKVSSQGITIVTGTQDQGQGTRGVMAVAVGDVTGWKRSDPRILFEFGSSTAFRSPKSGGSAVTASVFAPTRDATRGALDKAAKAQGLKDPDYSPDGVRHSLGVMPWDQFFGGVSAEYNHVVKRGYDKEYPKPEGWIDGDGFGLHAGKNNVCVGMTAEVEVDTKTGRIRVSKVWCKVNCGRVFVEETARNQIAGAVNMGIGYALFEDRQLDPETGHILTLNFDNCRIPTIADMPEVEVEFIDDGSFDHTKTGGVGIGEASMVPVAAAIASAIHHATGWRPTKLPIRPADVLKALGTGDRA